MPLTLDSVYLHQVVEIIAISNNSISSKLVEMGLTKGQKVKAVFKAPFGDPIAFEHNGHIISMRKEEAKQIEVAVA
jgi:ferrous iron transport protein A